DCPPVLTHRSESPCKIVAEHEAAFALGERTEDVLANERAALLVLDEQAEELVDRRLGRAGDRELCLAHLEPEVDLPRRPFAGGDLVPNRTALHGHDLRPITPVLGRGEAEEETDRRPPDGGLEREGGQVVAL